jgi:CBS domain containing-hemolysin-like protein
MFESIIANDLPQIGMILFCLIISAFFSAAETSITSLGAQKVKYLIKTRGDHAKQLRLWLTHPGRVLTTILIFNNGVNILASAVATAVTAKYFDSQVIGISTGITTFLVLIFGEIIPKSFGKTHPEATAIFTMKLIKPLEFIVRPLTKILSGFADGVINAVSEDGDKTPPMTEEELEFLVSESKKAGVIEDLKQDIIAGAFDFDETRVREIMTPRMDLSAVSTEDSFATVLKLCLDSGHSRIPVYRESIDQVVGVIMAKDLLKEVADPKSNSESIKLTSIMRDTFFVPESKSIMEVFKDLKKTKNHLAIIIDEYGGTAGIVTMEDILEEIVGDIQDEFDSEEAEILQIEKGVYDVSGAVNLDEFMDYFELDEKEIETDDADTLAGWLTNLVSELPKVGQSVSAGPLTMEVTEVDRHRIERVRVTRTPQKSQDPSIAEILGP